LEKAKAQAALALRHRNRARRGKEEPLVLPAKEQQTLLPHPAKREGQMMQMTLARQAIREVPASLRIQARPVWEQPVQALQEHWQHQEV
jgi:hypothetical protein